MKEYMKIAEAYCLRGAYTCVWLKRGGCGGGEGGHMKMENCYQFSHEDKFMLWGRTVLTRHQGCSSTNHQVREKVKTHW